MTKLNTPLSVEITKQPPLADMLAVKDSTGEIIHGRWCPSENELILWQEMIRRVNLHDEMKERIKELYYTIKDYKHHCDNRGLPSTDLDTQIEDTNELLTKLTNEEK